MHDQNVKHIKRHLHKEEQNTISLGSFLTRALKVSKHSKSSAAAFRRQEAAVKAAATEAKLAETWE